MTGALLKTVQLLISLAKSHASAVKRIIFMESEVNKHNLCILCNLKWLLIINELLTIINRWQTLSLTSVWVWCCPSLSVWEW